MININKKQLFNGIEVPVIEGGFGKKQKCILVKDIAIIHEMRINKINELIKNNIDEFEFGIDILDLKTYPVKGCFLENGLFTKAQWGNANHIYLLSEQGYMLLVGFMKTKKAKEIRKQLRREYFSMREIINSNIQLKKDLLFRIYEGGQAGAQAGLDLDKLEATPLLTDIENKSSIIEK